MRMRSTALPTWHRTGNCTAKSELPTSGVEPAGSRIIVFLFDEQFLLSPVCGYQPFVPALSHFQGVILAFPQAYIVRDGGKERKGKERGEDGKGVRKKGRKKQVQTRNSSFDSCSVSQANLEKLVTTSYVQNMLISIPTLIQTFKPYCSYEKGVHTARQTRPAILPHHTSTA
jgi:hypothetical protein